MMRLYCIELLSKLIEVYLSFGIISWYADRFDAEAVAAVLAKVPDVPPMPGDELYPEDMR